jgi:hypothetical protein
VVLRPLAPRWPRPPLLRRDFALSRAMLGAVARIAKDLL